MKKLLVAKKFRDYDEFIHAIQQWDLDSLVLEIERHEKMAHNT